MTIWKLFSLIHRVFFLIEHHQNYLNHKRNSLAPYISLDFWLRILLQFLKSLRSHVSYSCHQFWIGMQYYHCPMHSKYHFHYYYKIKFKSAVMLSRGSFSDSSSELLEYCLGSVLPPFSSVFCFFYKSLARKSSYSKSFDAESESSVLFSTGTLRRSANTRLRFTVLALVLQH